MYGVRMLFGLGAILHCVNQAIVPTLSHNSWYRNKKPGGDVMLEMERLTGQSVKGDENKGTFS